MISPHALQSTRTAGYLSGASVALTKNTVSAKSFSRAVVPCRSAGMSVQAQRRGRRTADALVGSNVSVEACVAAAVAVARVALGVLGAQIAAGSAVAVWQ